MYAQCTTKDLILRYLLDSERVISHRMRTSESAPR